MSDILFSRGERTMIALSDEQLARSRKNESVILKHLASIGQVHLANMLGIHESTVSRWKDKEFTELSQTLAALGLKVIPEEMRCYDPKSIDALLTLAKERMGQLESTDQLIWED